jgi:HEAT repeat protein
LGEYKTSEAIIPLMKMLNSEKSEGARIMAALSLVKIGTDKAVYAVKQAANFDKSERVRNMCEKFYNNFTYAENGQKDL